MMLSIILKSALANRFLVIFISVLLCAGGIYVLTEMDVDVFPDLTSPTVTIITEADGMEPLEVERLVTYHLETAINGSPGVRRIRSNSLHGVSLVWVEFDWGVDIYRARQIVSERLPIASERLPLGVSEPLLAPISSIMGEIMLVGLHSDSLSTMEVRTHADWEIVPQLKSITGVAQVIAIGGELKQYQVLADPLKMAYYKVSLEELAKAAQNANQNVSGGFINQYGQQYLVKSHGRIVSLEDLRHATLQRIEGNAIRIGDVAEIAIGSADKIGDASFNVSPAVVLIIFKQPQINTLNLTRDIMSHLDHLRGSLPPRLMIETDIFRQVDFIEASILNLQKTLLEGALFVSIVLFLFLLNWRTTLISLIAIPLSLLTSIIVLHVLGYTINTMSLGGLAIAIGALVDDAIIDVENVFKRLRENHHLPENERKPVLSIVYEASMEIRSSILIATLIIIVSFTPLFFLSGIEGRLLQPLGIAFITSLLTSLLVAITLTPVLASYLLSTTRVLQIGRQGTWLERHLRKSYERVLPFFLKYARIFIVLAIAGFIFCLILAANLGRSFLPEFNEGSIVVNITSRPGISLDESNRLGTIAESLLLEMPEINKLSRRTGRAETDEHAQGVHSSELDAKFLLDDKSMEEFFNEVRAKLSVIPGVNLALGQPIAHRIDHMLSGTRANIAIKIFGPDLDKLYGLGKRIRHVVSDIPGLVDLVLEQQIEVPQIRIIPNQLMLTRYGLTLDDLSMVIEHAIKGKVISQVYEGRKFFDLVVRYDKSYRDEMEELADILIETAQGSMVTVGTVAEVRSVSTPNSISREGISRKVVVSANVSGRDLRSVVEDIRDRVSSDFDVPQGYRVEYGGQFESEERASRILLLAAILSVILILVLLFYEFKDLGLAGIVMINLPLALIGGILIVQLTSGIISIASTIGFISLLGIATRNGILLVSRYQALDDEIKSVRERIITGSEDRLIPILMTGVTTALALIPIALAGNESGNEIQAPMALVILGGLISATFLNLVIIPCVYYLVKRE